MPKISRRNVPPQLFRHLLDRIQDRRIGAEQLQELARWLDGDPEVPEGPWYKRFSGLIACGEGQWIKTFLGPGQLPRGQRVS